MKLLEGTCIDIKDGPVVRGIDCTLSYNGESCFANTVFHLTDEQKELAGDCARNLSLFLGDGKFQYTEYGGTAIASPGNVRSLISPARPRRGS
ncbi:MAG: hypothetical protein HFF90_07060 [Oscillibacter sp.]|nr:hypothetical protein [Oscillibacter sp.]